MTKRKPVLVLFIITALFLIGGAALFAISAVFTQGHQLAVTFAELNQGIIPMLTGKNMLTNLLSVIASAVLFVLIPLIVHLTRKQHSVTVILLLGSLIALYVEVLLLSYIEIKTPVFEQIAKDEAALQELLSKALLLLLGMGLIAVSEVFELVTFIVDMAIRVKKDPSSVPTAQEMRAAEEEVPAEDKPVMAAKQIEKVEEPTPEEELKMEEEPEEEPEEEEAEEEPEEEEAPSFEVVEEEKPAKKAPEKKPARETQTIKKPASRETKTIKKPAARETQTIKKPTRETQTIKKPTRETQTVKKAEVLTNEEGKQFVKAYHVSQRKELNKWQVKGAGSEKAIKLFDTQKEAIEYANQLSANNGAAVRVHSRAGKMRKA